IRAPPGSGPRPPRWSAHDQCPRVAARVSSRATCAPEASCRVPSARPRCEGSRWGSARTSSDARTRPEMLIGAHVSSGGGLHRAVERGEERGAETIQIFHQSPRMWRPTRYTGDDFARFRGRLADSPIAPVYIRAVYLINVASDDK